MFKWAIFATALLLLNVAMWWRIVEAPPAAHAASAYLATDDASILVEHLAPRRFATIDVHEHAESVKDVERLLDRLEPLGVERACFLAAPRLTFAHGSRDEFVGFAENNEALLAAKAKHPNRVCVFVTLDPQARDNVARLSKYVARGADGLKLYLGHSDGPFHVMPLDDARLSPLFAYVERIQLPVTLHTDLVHYYDELVRLMDRFPKMRVNLPHFGLHKNNAQRLARLGGLLDRYPNLYTDVSFGYRVFHVQGFEALAAQRDRMREFLDRHADKVMFGVDLVVTRKVSDRFIDATARSYFQLLEEDRLRFFLRPRRPMRGLALSDRTLGALYRGAASEFLGLDERGNLPDRTINPDAPPAGVFSRRSARP